MAKIQSGSIAAISAPTANDKTITPIVLRLPHKKSTSRLLHFIREAHFCYFWSDSSFSAIISSIMPAQISTSSAQGRFL